MNFPVFDLHCDTACQLALGKERLRKNTLHIDLERAGKLSGYCQCFACFATPFMEQWQQGSAEEMFERELSAIRKELDVNKDVIRQVLHPSQIEENRKNGIMSAILTIEGPTGFHCDPAKLEELYREGFRITTLGWNERNPLTGSHVTGGGLTDLGRVFVKEAQRLGMLIDVSHISDEGFWDIMDMTEAPVIATHSNSRNIRNVSRNLTDEMFLEICRVGGVAGFNQYTDFVGDTPSLDSACDHIFHFLELDPQGSHISLGGDLDGCDTLVEGFNGVQDYPRLAAKLLERGAGEEAVYQIFWNNALGVMKKCCI